MAYINQLLTLLTTTSPRSQQRGIYWYTRELSRDRKMSFLSSDCLVEYSHKYSQLSEGENDSIIILCNPITPPPPAESPTF